MDLAGAKSDAPDNIYSLFKQNMKSCNAKRRRQRGRTVKNINTSSLQQADGYAISHQNNLELHLGCHIR